MIDELADITPTSTSKLTFSQKEPHHTLHKSTLNVREHIVHVHVYDARMVPCQVPDMLVFFTRLVSSYPTTLLFLKPWLGGFSKRVDWAQASDTLVPV